MSVTYAFTDIHGMYDLWKQIKEYCAEDDTIFFLGDANDRGPDGIKIIKELLADPRIIYLKGNHEELLIQNILEGLEGDISGFQNWAQNGGSPTWDALMKESDRDIMRLITKLQKLPYKAIYENPKGQQIYLSHSGWYRPNIKDKYSKWSKMSPDAPYIWDRQNLQHTNWSEKYPNAYAIHGHSPVQVFFNKEEPVIYYEGHKIDLDVASFTRKKIYLYNLDEMKIEKEFHCE